MKRCPNCNHENIPEDLYCVMCGNKLPNKFCKECGSGLLDDDLFCIICGTPVEEVDAPTYPYSFETEQVTYDTDETLDLNAIMSNTDTVISDLDEHKESGKLKINMTGGASCGGDQPVADEVKQYFVKPNAL